eukprot:jgi/Chrzof1/3906/Cz13g12250.t1
MLLLLLLLTSVSSPTVALISVAEQLMVLAAAAAAAAAAVGDGFSARAEDAILHGCLPVIIMDRVHAIFESIMEYDLFSVRIKQDSMHLLPEILTSIPADKVVQMQLLLWKVMHRFAYLKHPLLRKDFDDQMLSWETDPFAKVMFDQQWEGPKASGIAEEWMVDLDWGMKDTIHNSMKCDTSSIRDDCQQGVRHRPTSHQQHIGSKSRHKRKQHVTEQHVTEQHVNGSSGIPQSPTLHITHDQPHLQNASSDDSEQSHQSEAAAPNRGSSTAGTPTRTLAADNVNPGAVHSTTSSGDQLDSSTADVDSWATFRVEAVAAEQHADAGLHSTISEDSAEPVTASDEELSTVSSTIVGQSSSSMTTVPANHASRAAAGGAIATATTAGLPLYSEAGARAVGGSDIGVGNIPHDYALVDDDMKDDDAFGTIIQWLYAKLLHRQHEQHLQHGHEQG